MYYYSCSICSIIIHTSRRQSSKQIKKKDRTKKKRKETKLNNNERSKRTEKGRKEGRKVKQSILKEEMQYYRHFTIILDLDHMSGSYYMKLG